MTVEAPAEGPYQIEHTPDLGGAWRSLATLILPTGPFTFADDQHTDAPAGFYRVVSP